MGRLILVFFIFMVFCNEEKKEMKLKELPTQIVDEFSMWESVSGKKRYFIKGKKAYYYEKTSKIHLKGVDIVFYNDREKMSSHVIADSGVIDTRKGDLLAIGNVLVITPDSTFLYTDSIVWINRKKEIITDAYVRIVSKTGMLQGKGLTADANLIKIEIKTEISGTTQVDIEK